MMNRLIIVLAGLTVSLGAGWATEVFPSTHSKNMPLQSEAPVSSRQSDKLVLRYNITCYGVNNRSVSGPVHDQNCLKLETYIQKEGDPLYTFNMVFPAMLMDPTRAKPQVANPACPAPAMTDNPANWTLQFTNPQRKEILAQVRTNINAITNNVAPDGTRESNRLKINVLGVKLTQNGMMRLPNGTWGLGADGYVSNNPHIVPSENGYDYDINISFPGAIQAGQRAGVDTRSFCDAFYSPLMLFFDSKWPEFSGFSSFQVLPGSAWFAWPEPGAPGYFLALDRNGNGKIDDGDELFGEDQPKRIKNGFERLRELDSDKNDKIDANDVKFHSLLLWNDANGNGVSEPVELEPISKKRVVEISLKYKKNQTYPSGGAELRENSEFVYRNDKDKLAKGEIYDVWLSPTTPPIRGAASVAK